MRRGERVKDIATGALAVGAAAFFSVGIGVSIGALIASDDPGRLDNARSELEQSSRTLPAAVGRYALYENTLSEGCRTTLKNFVGNGINAEMDDGTAQILVTSTGECGGDITSVTKFRSENERLFDTKTAVRSDAQQVQEKKDDAETNDEWWIGGLINLGVVSVIAVGGALSEY